MANQKISELTAVTVPSAAAEVPVNEAGTTKKMTVTQILGLASSLTGFTTADNTALGTDAGAAITTADALVAVGVEAGKAVTSGANNTFVGDIAGLKVNTGGNNTAIGKGSLVNITSGANNTAVGMNAGAGSATSFTSTAFLGYQAGGAQTGNFSVGVGVEALQFNTTDLRVGIGYQAGKRSGTATVSVGAQSCTDSFGADYGTFVGYQAGKAATGDQNTAVGAYSLLSMTGGTFNTAVGYRAGQSVVSNGNNTFIGHQAGQAATSGNNTMVGTGAGFNTTSGANNVFLGYGAGANENTGSKLYISNSTTSTPLIWGDFANSDVLINGNLQSKVVSKVNTYTAAAENVILCDASGGAFSVNLPAAASSTNRRYVIKKIDASANAVTVDGDGAATIDGATTQALATQYDKIEVVCDGTAWFII